MFQTRETFFTAGLSRAYERADAASPLIPRWPMKGKLSVELDLTPPQRGTIEFSQMGPDGTTTRKCHEVQGRHQSMLLYIKLELGYKHSLLQHDASEILFCRTEKADSLKPYITTFDTKLLILLDILFALPSPNLFADLPTVKRKNTETT